MASQNPSRTKIYIIIIAVVAAIALGMLTFSSHSPQAQKHYGSVNITSVTVSYDNLSSIGSGRIPNASTIGNSYYGMPSSSFPISVSAPPGSTIAITVQTTYTFTGQAIGFMSETPGFSVLNSTYLYPSTKYVQSSAAASLNSTQQNSIISPGMLVGYTVYLNTPATGYYGSIRLVEVINNIDKSKVIAVNGVS